MEPKAYYNCVIDFSIVAAIVPSGTGCVVIFKDPTREPLSLEGQAFLNEAKARFPRAKSSGL